MASVQLRSVSKHFAADTPVLKNIDLDIQQGEFVIFVGPSGSGKSTLLRTLAGLEQASGGQIFMNDQDVTGQSARERQVAMVFQNYALYPHMTVARNITFGMRIRKEHKELQKQALDRVVSMLQLDGLLERKPRQLSGGQRQRVAMARAIVRDPELFLMDEPLSNLDAKLRNDVRVSIMELQKELGCTMVYVTHDQIEAMTMADRVVVLNHGEVQQIGTPQELYHFPQNRFTASFIGTPAMNFLPLTRQQGRLLLPDDSDLTQLEQLIPELETRNQALLGLRPEHLFISLEECLAFHGYPSRNPNDGLTPVRLKTRIHNSEMLGSEFLIHTDLGGHPLRFRHKNNMAIPAKGADIELHFSLANCHLFDTQTERRLGSPTPQFQQPS